MTLTARIGFVQSSPVFGDPAANRERLLEQAGRVEADVIVLPELCHTGYVFRSPDELAELAESIPGGPTCQALLDLARRRGAVIVAGICERAGPRFFNSAAVLGPQGLIGTYRKIHLFKDEKVWFAPGDEPPPVFAAGGFKLGVMICFDWRFPEVSRILALGGADMIAHPSNLVMPYCQEVMRARCIENRVFAVTANRVGTDARPDGARETFTGQSQVVDPEGQVLVRAVADRTAEAAVEIDLAEARRKRVNARNDLLADRRPELYAALVAERQEGAPRPAGEVRSAPRRHRPAE